MPGVDCRNGEVVEDVAEGTDVGTAPIVQVDDDFVHMPFRGWLTRGLFSKFTKKILKKAHTIIHSRLSLTIRLTKGIIPLLYYKKWFRSLVWKQYKYQ